MTITPYQDTRITTVDFTLTGPNGTEGFCNLTIPKIAIPFGTNPVVYIDGIVAENQSFTQDSDNFYIAFTTHFSTHQIEILFTTESNPYISNTNNSLGHQAKPQIPRQIQQQYQLLQFRLHQQLHLDQLPIQPQLQQQCLQQ